MEKVTTIKTKYYPTDKTARVLELYHLFITCENVTREEIKNGILGKYNTSKKKFDDWSVKTISRDLEILKHAGVPVRYSKSKEAFILSEKQKKILYNNIESEKTISCLNIKENQFIEKIKRLTALIKHMREQHKEEACDLYYKEMFPEISRRTMQRDFATLNSLGYETRYKSCWDNTFAGMEDYPPKHYYIWKIRDPEERE